MITKFARLEFELFTKPSKSDFLRRHQPLCSAERKGHAPADTGGYREIKMDKPKELQMNNSLKASDSHEPYKESVNYGDTI